MRERLKKDFCDYAADGIVIILIGVFLYVVVCFGRSNAAINYFAKTGSYGEKTDIDWEIQYPFADEKRVSDHLPEFVISRYLKTINNVTGKTDNVLSQYIPFKYHAVRALKKIELAIGYDLQVSRNTEDIIYLKNGSLTYVQPKTKYVYLEEIAGLVQEFAESLKTSGISFFYVNVGSKVCPFDKQMYPENVEYSNENADAFLRMLEKRGVDCLDFRKEMISHGMNWYDAYYITDHHWKTETGLWAAGVIAEKLNNEYGYSFDKRFFEQDSYCITNYDNFWAGSLGRKDAFATIHLEPYSLILPAYETNYTLKIPTRGIALTGSYTSTLFDLQQFEQTASYTKSQHLSQSDAYHAIRMENHPLIHLSNNLMTNNNGKKILFLQDSYGWYCASYLASDVSGIDTIFAPSFNGSIRRYIEDTKPDTVIMLYDARKLDEKWRACFEVR